MWRGNGMSIPPLPCQMMHFDHVGSRANTSTDSVIDESSRKRKIMNLEENSSIYHNGSSFHGRSLIHGTGRIPKQTSSNNDVIIFHERNIHASQMHMNQVPPSTQTNKMLDQHGNYPMYDLNKLSKSSQSGTSFQLTKTENSVPHAQPHQESSASVSNAIVEIPRLPYSQHFTYNVAGSAETSNPAPHSSGISVSIEKNQANLTSEDGKNLQQVSYRTSSLAPSVAFPGSSKSTEFCQEMTINNELLYHDGSLFQKNKILNSCNAIAEAERANTNHILDVADSQGTVYCPNSSASTTCVTDYSRSQGSSIDTSVNIRSDVQLGLFRSQTMSATGDTQVTSGSSSYTSADSKIKISKSQNSSDTGKICEENLFGTCATHSMNSFQGEGKTVTGKTTSPIVETLWDGNIRLNASTTVSTVVFFKSGEKATNIDWPQCVEVKGKVRLEAFEKFIQELPRSRNRALMVTSLCWKAGSPESGLTGIKEVSKGYKEGQRVGYAQLNPGIDLYVCPRSETIITILAKYGFFKGMAAVEEDRDSLIGCVVWRRNVTPPIAASNKCETKNFHPQKLGKFPSDSNHQNAEPNSLFTGTQDCEQNHTTLCIKEMVGNSAGHASSQNDETKNNSNMALPSCTDIKHSGTVASIQNHQVIPMKLPDSQHPCISSLQNLVEQGPKAEIPTSVKLDISAPTSSTPRTSKNSANDDDLPEFDFGIACGSHQPGTSQLLRHQGDLFVGPPSKKQEHAEASTPPAPPISRSIEVASFEVPYSLGHTFSSSQSVAQENKIGKGMTNSKPGALSMESPMPPELSRTGQVDVSFFQSQSSFDRFSAQKVTTQANKIGEHINGRRLASQTIESHLPPASPRSRQMDASQAPSSFEHTYSTLQGIAPAQKIGDHMIDGRLATQMMEKSHKYGTLEVKEVLVRDRTTSSGPRKSFWDDDDDMPEWCPPDMEHRDISRQAPPLPPAPPPLSPYPHPLQCSASKPMQPSQIQPTSEASPLWPPLSSRLQVHVQPSHDQGISPLSSRGILGQGPKNNDARMTHDTGFSSGMHPDETTISHHSSGVEMKPCGRPSSGQNPNQNLKPWHNGFSREYEEAKLGFDRNEDRRHHSKCFNENRGQKLPPAHKQNDARRRPLGFDNLPDRRSSSGFSPRRALPNRRSSPRFSPKHSSKSRRPSLFDVRPDSSNMDRRGKRH